MNGVEDITRKRSILLTTRMRFSPQIQPVKEAAIEKIIEQILFAHDTKNGLDLQKIQNVLSSETGGYAISLHDIEDSIKRLEKKGRVALAKEKSKLYKLSAEASQELGLVQSQAESRFSSVVDRLFRNAKDGSLQYNTPFLKFLCIIFSKLADEYVKVIKGDIKKDEFLSTPFVFSAFDNIDKSFPTIDQSLFRKAVISFFQDSDPEYDAIKWNMTQSYYTAKALGLDPSGVLLSTEVFGQAVFYLDTNIIVPALEPKHRQHVGFLAFNKACKLLGISLRVCQISLFELQKWIVYQRDLMKKVIGQIPEEIESKVQSIFYEIYCEKKKSGEETNIDELFTSFNSPMDNLKDLFKVELEDNIWFDEAKDKTEVIEFAKSLKSRYIDMRGKLKKDSAALHDSLLLFWLQKERKEEGSNSWLLTDDRSLPGIVPPNTSIESFAITLDPLLQWISPAVVSEDRENVFTAMFAEMIKYRILPQERILDLEDFLIFHEMHMSCKELPAEDVEGCIRYIKANAPILDPTNPADREKLSYEVSKYFADPGRKYKQEITRLEAENIEIKEDYERRLGEANKEIDKIKNEHEKDLKERDARTEKLGGKITELEEKNKRESLKRSARFRLDLVMIVFLFFEALAIFLANQYGKGQNLFQKISNSWHFLIEGFALTIVIGWFIIGKKRLEALGWPFTKIFKRE